MYSRLDVFAPSSSVPLQIPSVVPVNLWPSSPLSPYRVSGARLTWSSTSRCPSSRPCRAVRPKHHQPERATSQRAPRSTSLSICGDRYLCARKEEWDEHDHLLLDLYASHDPRHVREPDWREKLDNVERVKNARDVSANPGYPGQSASALKFGAAAHWSSRHRDL